MNKVFLIGRLTRDPQASTTESGRSYCRFSIAVDRFSRDRENSVDFINIITWNELASNCVKYLQKGSQVAVFGSIQTGSYERDGVKRQTFDVRADQVEFLTRANGGAQQGGEGAVKDEVIDELKQVDDDDMPF
ncbi:MAG: single-stranded DNA-binding protein [Clostridiales bacterium]|nr:single-stranded DNA-binding protein [Clostridiales bacterium]